MRMNLKVPFAEKDEAKKLGARWDAARKLWYVEDDSRLPLLARWSPTPHVATDGPAARQQASGKVMVGSAYRPWTPVCTCPPWQDCAQCRAALAG